MLRWSRVRLYLSIIDCEGLIATLRERIQFAPATKKTGNSPLQSEALRDYCGSLHIHSTYSDGVEPIPKIAAAANEAGLDFILICDHSSLDAISDDQAGWYDKTLVLIGTEVTTDTGHVLALDVPPDYLPSPHEAVAAQRHIADKGGQGFIALPCDLKDSWKDIEKHVDGVGLEVFNLSAIARTKINLPGLLAVWSRYHSRNPLSAFHLVSARPDPELKLWDRMIGGDGAERAKKVVGIASVDAHGVMKFMGKSYFMPTYKEVFQTLRTHVLPARPLSGTPERAVDDAKRLYDAFREGHCYMSYDNYADATGFRFEASSKGAGSSKTIAMMGDDASVKQHSRGIELTAEAPRRNCFMRILRNGKVAATGRDGSVTYQTTEPGAYRVEAYLYQFRIGALHFGVLPWIFSNPIYLVDSTN